MGLELQYHAWILTWCLCPQWQVDSIQRDVGRMLCWDVPGHYHYTHGDAQDPVAGCRQAR